MDSTITTTDEYRVYLILECHIYIIRLLQNPGKKIFAFFIIKGKYCNPHTWTGNASLSF
jgi:hypothetical protein